jgi:hypothetical protein
MEARRAEPAGPRCVWSPPALPPEVRLERPAEVPVRRLG